MLIGIVGWMMLGTLMGYVASRYVSERDDDPRPTIVVGAAGALLGGWIYSFISGSAVTPFNPRSLFAAAIVAVVALASWLSWRRNSAY